MKATVDDTCIGCRLCVEICPAVFEMTDEEVAGVTADPVPPDAEEDCRKAAEACPVAAIHLE